MSTGSALDRIARRTGAATWAVILACSLLVHLVALVAITLNLATWIMPPKNTAVLSVRLIQAQEKVLSSGEAEAPPRVALESGPGMRVVEAPPAAAKPRPERAKPAAPGRAKAPARAEGAKPPAPADASRPPTPADASKPPTPPETSKPPGRGAEAEAPAQPAPPPAAAQPASPPPDQAGTPPQPAADQAAARADNAAAATPPAPADANAGASLPAGAASPAAPAVDPNNDARLKAVPPPAASIDYDAQIAGGYYRVRLDWAPKGEGYTLSLREVRDQFWFESKGFIGLLGLQPERYTDKRPFRSMTAATFDYLQQRITFSTTPEAVPLKPGAQDLISIALQLCAFANGDVTVLRSGVLIDMQVADTRRATQWQWRAVAEESIDTGMGPVKALHIVRQAPPGSFEATVEVWLGEGYDWLPVRIKRTELNGGGWDLAATGIRR